MSEPRFHHISLTCDDPVAVEEFYMRHFGFRRARVVETGDTRVVFLRGAGTLLELFQADRPNPLRPPDNDGYLWSGVRNFSFEVDSVEGKLAAMGADAVITLGPLDFSAVVPGWKSVWLRDPTGGVIQITEGYVDQENPPPR